VQIGDYYGSPRQWEAGGVFGADVQISVLNGANVEITGSRNAVIQTLATNTVTLNNATFYTFIVAGGANTSLVLVGNNTGNGTRVSQVATRTISGTGSLVIGGSPYAGDITTTTITLPTNLTADGTPQEPTPTVTMMGLPLVPNTHFTYTHANNIDPGTATVTITGIGNFTGSTTADFTINPAQSNQQPPPPPPQPPITPPPPPPQQPPPPTSDYEEWFQEPEYWVAFYPNNITFDIANPQDITITMSMAGEVPLNMRLPRIGRLTHGGRPLTEGEHWSAYANQLTIYTDFLNTLPQGRRFINVEGHGQIRVDVIETEPVQPSMPRIPFWLRILVWLNSQI